MFRIIVALVMLGLPVEGAVDVLAAFGCKEWRSSKYRYALCLPGRWYHRAMPSGALFLCDEPRGKCTTAVGGGPLSGHATLSVIPSQIAVDTVPATLHEFAHLVADNDSSSKFSEMNRIESRFGTIDCLLVQQTFTTGGLNEMPREVYLYFAKVNHQMIEVILTFNAGDKRSSSYKDIAVKVISSIRLT